jgi:predicted DNA-binding antitoxin AbrB/MazE fold protein
MMNTRAITVEAIYDNGVFRPAQPVELTSGQQVTLVVQMLEKEGGWPDDTAEIYREIGEADRKLAENMWRIAGETWPVSEEQS